MALVFYFVGSCLFAIVRADVSLVPSGNVSVCASGAEISLICVTEGSLLWITPTGNQFFSGLQAPTSEGRFDLVVNSAGPSITSTASLSDFQPEDDGIFIKCREFTTDKEAEAVLRFAGAPNVTLSKLNASVFISWNPSTCMQYIVTIINSSDDSVYSNITTSDTNTTVTLPTGVEFCVTVLGVDSINRTGPASEPQCYPPIITTSTITQSGSNTATTPSPTVPVDQPSGVSGGAIAGAVIGGLIVIILAVLVTAVAVIVFVIYRKGYCKKSKGDIEPLVVGYTKEYQCVCHTFYQDVGLNSWKVVFVFIPSRANFEVMKTFYEDYQVYGSGSPFDCHLKSSGTIQVKVPNKLDGWTVHTSDKPVQKADIEEYTGEGKPPHLEMMITAASDKTTPPDLTVEAMFKGVQKPNIIKFEKEAQNVVECVCQVFYHKEARNHWRATFAFFPKLHKEKVNQLYQDANNCKCFDVKFGGGVIKVSTDDTVIPAGWEVTINQQYQQVTTAAVELYTGEGEPPYCEMTLRATGSDKNALTKLKLPVTIIGVRQPNNIFNIERALVAPDGTPLCASQPILSQVASTNYCCQVFYHKRGLNYWKATLAFFSKNSPIPQRVQHFYQDVNSDPPVDIEFAASVGVPFFESKIGPILNQFVDGWTVAVIEQHKEVTYAEIVQYVRGLRPPPHCEISLKADSDETTPPDLILNIILRGVDDKCNKLAICRAAETVQSSVNPYAEMVDYTDSL